MSTTLAVEASTTEPSLALLDGDGVIAERRWTSAKGDATRLLAEIRAMTDEHGIALDAVSLFAVGLGPGGFTGLRIAVATVQALALPSRTPVIGVCSADATALAARRETGGAGPVLVVGDARRERLWAIPSPRTDGGGLPEVLVVAAADAAARMDGMVVATPDWDRLAAVLDAIAPASASLVRHPLLPSAADIGRLAILHRDSGGGAPAPVEPLYVHPPVFVAPMFTGSAEPHPAPIP